MVATFEVRDDDIEIAPHPFGVHKVEFMATQDPGDGTPTEDHPDVTHAFKIVKAGDDGRDTAEYEIHAKTAAELAMGADRDGDDEIDVYAKGHEKEGEVIPVDPIDYEEGDEIDFEITVTDMDGDGESDDRSLSIDVEDAPDESPMFQRAVTGGTVTRDDNGDIVKNSTTISVAQETEARTILVMRLDELWEDADTDDDDLTFDVDGTGDLPDWIKVYGPDRWEDIYENRRNDFTDDEVEDVSGVRDRDEVVVIVMDRTAADGENVSLDGGSFTISADDGTNDPVTETIMIDVSSINVDPADPMKVVSISGGDPNKDKEVTGTGDLMMTFNSALDPNIAGGQAPYLVLYTWSVSTGVDDDAGTDEDESMTTISVSTTPQPLMLGVRQADGTVIRNTTYIDQTITAKVEVFEFDGANDGKITMAQEYTATVEVASAGDAPVVPPPPTSVTFGDILTTDSNVTVTITTTGDASQTDATARLEASPDGNAWVSVDTETVDTSGGSATTTALDVNENADGTDGDGGGLYYRVVFVYQDEDDEDVEEPGDMIQLGSIAADPTTGATGMVGGTTAASSGDAIRVDTGTNTVEVQWQMGTGDPGADNVLQEAEVEKWTDIAGETDERSLTLTDAQAGNLVRAKVTYKELNDDDDPSHVNWVEYSTVVTVAPLPTSPNSTPDRTQETYWIEVDLNSDDDEGTGTGNVSGFFFDSDGDSLTYSLVGTAVDDGANGIQPGNTVFRASQDDAAETGNAGQIILTLDEDTGDITFYTNRALSHDNDVDADADSGGNWFTVTVQASDGKPDPVDTVPDLDPLNDSDDTDDLTINVRVNVAPTAINLGGTAIEDDATATATVSGISLAETDDFDATTAGGTTSVAIDVQDLNDGSGDDAHSYGTHTVTVDDKRFEVVSEVASGGTEDNDASTWVLRVKDGAEFDFEDDDDEDADDATDGKQIVLKITATDGGDKKTEGYVTVTITDVETDDPQDNQPASRNAGNGGVMTTGGDAGDNDGGGNAPGDGGIWVESDFTEVDLFESYMLIIDDIDIA